MSGRGLYIHVPFCQSKCAYCDFYSIARGADHESYLRSLEREAALQQGAEISTVFFGGGTPSLLTASQVSAVLAMVSRYFLIQADAEITMEMNPGTIGRSYLADCLQAGVNRVSFGVQSFEPRLLRFLGRRHTVEDALQAVSWAAELGFPHLNLDLIYGIPTQTMADWQSTLLTASDLPIDHLSLYALEVHAETPLGRDVAAGACSLLDDDTVADMYQLAQDFLPTNGLAQYEISNFARSGAVCRHNLNYWENGEYVGLGPAACSYLQGVRCCNPASLVEWAEPLSAGKAPRGQCEQLTERESMAETIILGLRLVDGVDGAAFRRRFGQALEEAFGDTISKLLGRGLLRRTEQGYALPPALLSVANQVMLEFLP